MDYNSKSITERFQTIMLLKFGQEFCARSTENR